MVPGDAAANGGLSFAYNINLSLKSKLILKYSVAIAALKALGAWGVLIIAVLDAAAFGVPMDPLVAGFVYSAPHKSWLYCLAASAGSALGSLIPFYIGRAGGELFLLKRIDEARLLRLRDRFAKQEFLALMVPAMLPPPTPFKLLVFSAGVFEMKVMQFVLAVLCGRLLRFGILSALTIYFGPQVVATIKEVVKHHLGAGLATLAAAAIVGYLIYRWRKTRVTAPTARD
ncbi:MAG TPA: VTT domain-containing protein [Candidatus Saccharimonadales bacterium]|jgi:membrane protein YqaA with SNARE-associated domain|nr:VTT domain-containing protein [Candidatus Saccharimonadales bacterium]